jgi:ATP-dependent DNA helicase RecQ
VLQLTSDALGVLRGTRTVHLVDPKARAVRSSKAAAVSWDGVDPELFERLRGLRREIADERGVPPYIVFGDAVLRDLARLRPSTPPSFRSVPGIGEKKLADFGPAFLEAIANHCREHALPMDLFDVAPASPARVRSARLEGGKERALALFEEGAPLDDVVEASGRALETVIGYLVAFIEQRRPADVRHWVDDATYERIVAAAGAVGADRLKPIREALEGAVSYGEIRIVLAHSRAMGTVDGLSPGTDTDDEPIEKAVHTDDTTS